MNTSNVRVAANDAQPTAMVPLSRALATQVNILASGDVEGFFPSYDPGAAIALKALQPMLKPASRDKIRSWLVRLAAGTTQAPGDRDFEMRLAAVCLACGDLPGAVWNTGTLMQATRTCKFFPSAAEVYELLERHGSILQRRARALEKIAAAPPFAGNREQPEPYEVTYVPDWAKKSDSHDRLSGDVSDSQTAAGVPGIAEHRAAE